MKIRFIRIKPLFCVVLIAFLFISQVSFANSSLFRTSTISPEFAADGMRAVNKLVLAMKAASLGDNSGTAALYSNENLSEVVRALKLFDLINPTEPDVIIHSVEWSPNGKFVFVDYDGPSDWTDMDKVIIFDTITMKRHSFGGGFGNKSYGFSGDERLFVFSTYLERSRKDIFRICDLSTGNFRDIPLKMEEGMSAYEFEKKGYGAFGSPPGKEACKVKRAELSYGGRYLVVLYEDKTAQVFDLSMRHSGPFNLESVENFKMCPSNDPNEVYMVIEHVWNTMGYVGHDRGMVETRRFSGYTLNDASTGDLDLQGQGGPLKEEGFLFSPDGRYILFKTYGSDVLYDVWNLKPLVEELEGSKKAKIDWIFCSPDFRYALVVYKHEPTKLFRLPSADPEERAKKPVRINMPLDVANHMPINAEFSQDGKLVMLYNNTKIMPGKQTATGSQAIAFDISTKKPIPGKRWMQAIDIDVASNGFVLVRFDNRNAKVTDLNDKQRKPFDVREGEYAYKSAYSQDGAYLRLTFSKDSKKFERIFKVNGQDGFGLGTNTQFFSGKDFKKVNLSPTNNVAVGITQDDKAAIIDLDVFSENPLLVHLKKAFGDRAEMAFRVLSKLLNEGLIDSREKMMSYELLIRALVTINDAEQLHIIMKGIFQAVKSGTMPVPMTPQDIQIVLKAVNKTDEKAKPIPKKRARKPQSKTKKRGFFDKLFGRGSDKSSRGSSLGAAPKDMSAQSRPVKSILEKNLFRQTMELARATSV